MFCIFCVVLFCCSCLFSSISCFFEFVFSLFLFSFFLLCCSFFFLKSEREFGFRIQHCSSFQVCQTSPKSLALGVTSISTTEVPPATKRLRRLPRVRHHISASSFAPKTSSPTSSLLTTAVPSSPPENSTSQCAHALECGFVRSSFDENLRASFACCRSALAHICSLHAHATFLCLWRPPSPCRSRQYMQFNSLLPSNQSTSFLAPSAGREQFAPWQTPSLSSSDSSPLRAAFRSFLLSLHMRQFDVEVKICSLGWWRWAVF